MSKRLSLDAFPHFLQLELPLICGREGDGDEGNKPAAGGAGEGDNEKPGDKSGEGKNSDADLGDPQKKIKAQDEIIARKQQLLDEGKAELEELRKFKEEADNAKLSEQEKIDKRIKELEESNSKTSSAAQKLVLTNAFLLANNVAWHDPEIALSLLDTSELQYVEGKNGELPTLKDRKPLVAAIEKLKTEKPFLVKGSTEQEGDDEHKPAAWKGKTGTPPSKKGSEEIAERERLLSKFPALRRR